MKIEGTPKEIADFVTAIQSQHEPNKSIQILDELLKRSKENSEKTLII